MSDVDPFRPEGVEWTPVSRRLVGVRLVSTAVTVLVLSAIVTAGALISGRDAVWTALAVPVAILVFSLVTVPRLVRAWGYAEREDDLLIRHGIMFRSLVVVPYGRMQYVDVSAGPLDRLFGVAGVQLHTASASTDASIPGLVPAEAARLRDRLTARGQARLAGL